MVDFDERAKEAVAFWPTVDFVEPAGWDVLVTWADPSPRAVLRKDGKALPKASKIEIGLDRILEMAIPFELLGVAVGQPVQFYVELLQDDQSRDRAPREGTIQLTRPGADFELRMWNV